MSVPGRAAPIEAIAAHGVFNVDTSDGATAKQVTEKCESVPVASRGKWQLFLKPPAEEQRYGLTGTVPRYAQACRHRRLSSHT
jgi:hypothetical protein